MVLKRYFFLLLKLSAGVLLVWILYRRISADFLSTDFNQYLLILSDFSHQILLCIAVLLMPLNWCLEAYKWQLIVNGCLSRISFFTALKSVLSGVAFGNLTPGRATEFAGKIFFIRREERVTATYLHFINGSSQMLITVVMGILALVFTCVNTQGEDSVFFRISLLIMPLPGFLLALFFFTPDYFFRKLKRIPFVRKQKQEHVSIPQALSLKILFLSFTRYIIFSAQFVLLLIVFTDGKSGFPLFSGVILYYLFITLLPMFSLVEAFMRGGIAVLVFSNIIHDALGLFIASSVLWLVNIVFASLLGYLFFLFLKPQSAHR
jgi:hypothetical protein